MAQMADLIAFLRLPKQSRCGSIGGVAAPQPHERIRQCLLENPAVAVAGGKA